MSSRQTLAAGLVLALLPAVLLSVGEPTPLSAEAPKPAAEPRPEPDPAADAKIGRAHV